MKDEFQPFHETFLCHAATTPDVVALEFQEQRLTYRDLATRSGRFATYLHELGVGAETVVGLALERSPELIVAILGILRAGGAWVPLDPSYPAERLAYMLEDSGVDLLVTDDCGVAGMPETGVHRVDPRAGSRHPADEPPATALTPENLAYVIYTSGSTGRPKRVALTHGGLINMAETHARIFGLGPGKRILQFAPTSFDASVAEIAMALYAGATLVLAPRAAITPGLGLADLLRTARITQVALPPSVLATLPDTDLPDLETLVCAGEALPEPLAQRWLIGRRLFNAYGPTETTVSATIAEVHAGSGKPSIGRAIDGVRTVVLDARLAPAPVGEPGELAIGGKGLARGYLGAPALTAQRFIADRFGPEPGGRLYRTGDLVRLRPDGDLEFLGRIDHQVKLGGFRIEPDEVAAALREHPCVRDAVVVVRHDGGAGRLVAYATGTDLASLELRAFLAGRLPAHLVPSSVVVLSVLPLSPNGKVDRAALPAPDRAGAGLPAEPVAPQTPTEQILTRLVSELLGVDEVGVDDDFFRLGGHSLLAGMLAARVRSELRRELPLSRMYQAPTVAAMAVLLDSLPGSPEFPSIVPVPRDEPLPLSFPQERVWFLEQLAPGNLAYNAQATVHLRGPLDPDALEATLTEIVRRHEIFRSRFWAVDGVPVQQPIPPMPIHLPLIDLSNLPEPERNDRAEDVIWRSIRDPFDLDRPPLARWLLIRHAEQDHTLIHVEHHFVHDGWSGAVFLKELQVIYSAFAQRKPAPLAEPPYQFADFAVWQRRWLRDDVLDRYLEFWTKELAGSSHALDLPTDRPRPAMQSFEGAALRIDLPPVLCRTLREFSRERGVTLYTSMLAGFTALLHRYTGQTDLLIGCAAANRRLAETEHLIGMVVNTIVLRLDTSAQSSFDELLGRVHGTIIRTHDWQDIPLDRLVNALDLARDNSRNPLFQVMFSFHDSPVPEIDFAGLSGTLLERHNGSAKTDLNIVVIPRAEQRVGRISRDDAAPITLIWEYATSLFDETTMRQMVAHYENLLNAALSRPEFDIGRLPMLGADEQLRLLIDYNDTTRPMPQTCLPALFQTQVAATPQAVAVAFEDTTLTYTRLNTQANQLAHALIASGVGPERIVALALPRSPELVVAILAVLKAGACYLPVDPDYPAARIGFMLRDARPMLVLTSKQTEGGLPDSGGTARLVIDDLDTVEMVTSRADTDPTDADRTARLLSQHPAYVIYTSGSTGKPKGVIITHCSLTNFLLAMRECCPLRYGDRLVAVTTLAFDIAALEMYLPLISGATVVVAAKDVVEDSPALAELISVAGGTVMQATPTLWQALLASSPDMMPGLRMLVGGEALPAALAVLMREHGSEVINLYGPTETTVWSTAAGLDETTGHSVIGRPISNTRVYVLDAHFQVLPAGVTGELYVAGSGVARGYLGRAGLTAERFLACPFSEPGSRMYRTGDLVHWNTEGNLVFVGRVDDQVKVRGFRIEPGEIETVLASHSGVAQAVVIARQDRPGYPEDKKLIAYVVPAVGNVISTGELREFARVRLPEYMVPAVVVLDSLPVTSNGKLDRAALPAPELGSGGAGRAPRTPQEQILAELFEQVLGVSRVGIEDDFFALGGDSIVSIRLVARARAAGMVITVRDVFAHRTVAGLAGIAAEAGEIVVGGAGAGIGGVASTPIMCWLAERGGEVGRFYQSMLLRVPPDLGAEHVAAALSAVLDHHDALRSRLRYSAGDAAVGGGWVLEVTPAGTVPAADVVHRVVVAGLDGDGLRGVISEQTAAAAGRLDPGAGVMVQVVWCDAGPDAPGMLLVMIHHLVVDGVSWRILVPDLVAAWEAITTGDRPRLEPVGTAFRWWSQRLQDHAQDPERVAELALWTQLLSTPDPVLTDRVLDPGRDVAGAAQRLSLTLPPEITGPLVTRVAAAFHGEVNDVLLTALALALAQWRHRHGRGAGSAVLVEVEGHGREEIIDGVDLSRTVGWFTSLFPVRLDPGPLTWDELCAGGPAVGAAIKRVKEQLRALPDHGIGFGLLRYLNAHTGPHLAALPSPQIGFNYLGRFPVPAAPADSRQWAPAPEATPPGGGSDPTMPLAHGLAVNALVCDDNHDQGPWLQAHWSFAPQLWSEPDVREIAQQWFRAIQALVEHGSQPGAGGHTPTDFPLVSLSQTGIEQLEAARPGLLDVWPLAPMQETLVAHESGGDRVPDAYMTQLVVKLRGALDVGALRAAAETLLRRHPNLRAGFWHDGLDKPVQFVRDDLELPWSERDLSDLPSHECAAEIARVRRADRARRFSLADAPLMRFTVLGLGPDRHQLVWTVHHLLVDGWSMPVLLGELMTLCQPPGERGLPAPTSYRQYLTWLGAQDRDQTERAWRDMLAGLENPTLVTLPAPTRRPEAPHHVTVELPEKVTLGLQQQARQHGLTMNTLVQGAWALTLGQLTGSDDVVYGTTLSGRVPEIAGVATMAGFLINTLPVRVRLDPAETLVQILTRMQDYQATMTQHQHVSLADIARLTGLGELFDTVTVFQNYPNSPQTTVANGLRATVVEGHDAWHYPLRLIAVPGPRLALQLWYRPDRLDHSTAQQIALRVARLATTMAADLVQSVGETNGPKR